MSFIFELLFRLIFEIAAFGVGRVFVMTFMPWYGVEPVTHEDPQRDSWKWRGFSYRESGRRYLRVESVQLIGLAILVGVMVMIAPLSQ
jgi:hypothetical protein